MVQDLEIWNLKNFRDERGEFIRIYDIQNYKPEYGAIKQLNISRNPNKYTLRGLHFQKNKETEHKIMYLNSGELFLVVVDLRQKSSTYLEKFERYLKFDEDLAVFIPAGCATGWLSIKEDTEIIYLMYDRFEDCTYGGIRFDDPTFNISWPHKPKVISKKDSSWDFHLKHK